MGWREQLLPASFRGVPFGVQAADQTSGRKVLRHEYPFADEPYHEDLGRRTRAFRVEGFLVGEDYMEQRDALLGVCEQSGPGELIHPHRGRLLVVCLEVTVRETHQDGGYAQFGLTFEETRGTLLAPSEEEDAEQGVEDAAGAVLDQAKTEVEEQLVVEGAPEFVRGASAAEVTSLGERLRGLSGLEGVQHDVAVLANRAKLLLNTASSLATSPADLAFEVVAAVQQVRAAAGSALGSLAAYEILADTLPSVLSGGSAAQQQAYGNAAAVTALIRRTAIAEASKAAAAAPWASYDEALAARDAWLARLDAEIESEGLDDLAYLALEGLRSALASAVPPPDEDLPRLAAVTLRASTPAPVLAYRLYDDVGRAQEIVDRNHVRHPGFLPAETPLEVLVDA